MTISTVGEKAQAFVPAPLPPDPPIEWSAELRNKFDQALLALGRLDSVRDDSSISGWERSFGRLLITLLLCEQKVLKQPMLYLSLYFKTHRQYYYELLNGVRLNGDWERWLDFFAEAVIVTATQAVESAQQLLQLSKEDHSKIIALGRAAASTIKVHQSLLERPISSAGWLAEVTGISPATDNNALVNLEKLGIVKELTAQKRNRIFGYKKYVEIMNRGTELPE